MARVSRGSGSGPGRGHPHRSLARDRAGAPLSPRVDAPRRRAGAARAARPPRGAGGAWPCRRSSVWRATPHFADVLGPLCPHRACRRAAGLRPVEPDVAGRVRRLSRALRRAAPPDLLVHRDGRRRARRCSGAQPCGPTPSVARWPGWRSRIGDRPRRAAAAGRDRTRLGPQRLADGRLRVPAPRGAPRRRGRLVADAGPRRRGSRRTARARRPPRRLHPDAGEPTRQSGRRRRRALRESAGRRRRRSSSPSAAARRLLRRRASSASGADRRRRCGRGLARPLPPWSWPRILEPVRSLPRLPNGKADRPACIAMLGGPVGS